MAERLVEDIFTALDEQTVVVPGTDAAAVIVPKLAANLSALLDQRKQLASSIEELLESHPLSQLLTSMPGKASGPEPGSSSTSATDPPSPPPDTSPPTPDSPQ